MDLKDIEKLKDDAMKEAFMNVPENDNVNHPNHYIHGKYETIEVLKDWLTPGQFEGFCLGNVMKYLSRWENKGGIEDLKKASWYLNCIIKYMEGEYDA